MLSPIILFYSLLVVVVFAIGFAPTALWMRFGSSVSGAAARGRQASMRARFTRATEGVAFTPDVNLVPEGIGFALDSARRLVFAAAVQNGAAAEAVLSLSSLRGYASRVDTGGFTEERYIDLLPADPVAPGWRIACHGDAAAAQRISRSLDAAGLTRD